MSESELFHDSNPQLTEDGELQGEVQQPPRVSELPEPPQQPAQQPPQQPAQQPPQAEQRSYKPPSAARRRPSQQQRGPPQQRERPQQPERSSKVRRVEPLRPASQRVRAPPSNGAGKALQPLRQEALYERLQLESRSNRDAFLRACEEKQAADQWALHAEARATRAEQLLEREQKLKRGQQQRELQLVRAQEEVCSQRVEETSRRAETAFARGVQEGLRLAQQSHANAAQFAGFFKPCRRGGKKHHVHVEASSSGA